MTEEINPQSKTVSPIWSPAAAGSASPVETGWYMARDTSLEIYKGQWIPVEVYTMASGNLRGKPWGDIDADEIKKWHPDHETFWSRTGPWEWMGPIILPNSVLSEPTSLK